MQWYSKCVVMVSLSGSSAGCCTGQKSSISKSSGTTTSPPGCWPVVRRTPTQPAVRRSISALPAAMPFSSRYFFDEAVGRLLRERTDRTRAEHLRLAEHLDRVRVGARLIFA